MSKETPNSNTSKIPSISITLPVHKKYPHFKLDEQKMKTMVKQCEELLHKDFSSKEIQPLIDKLRRIVGEIDYKKLSEGLGIFVSIEQESVIHFPFPVKEKLIMDSTFEIRDLVYAAKSQIHYAVLLISENKCKVLEGYNETMTEIQHDDFPKGMAEVGGKSATRISSYTAFSSKRNVSDPQEYEEKELEKYLMEIDRAAMADETIKMLPWIICSPTRSGGHFKAITKNAKNILGYVHGNFEDLNEKEIYQKISEILVHYRESLQDSAMVKLDEMISGKRVVSGIQDVWKSAKNKEGQLLLVEKDYYCSAVHGKIIFDQISSDPKADQVHNKTDVVDEIIELVFTYGGDIVFMDNGRLTEFNRIALIKYF